MVVTGSANMQCVAAVTALIADALAGSPQRLLVIGIAGAQGSGKSTLAGAVAARLNAQGTATAALSLDDLYLTRSERLELAAREHPLLATRGVPGTHDAALGLATIAALERGEAVPLPRFDKARDDRRPADDWPLAHPRTQVLLFEGWCIGARPQTPSELALPANKLEADEDRDGRWRGYANAALAGDYARLFARIDRLVLLAAPGFEVVARWRGEQEAALRAASVSAAPTASDTDGSAETRGLLDAAQLRRFIAHYERITRAMLAEMPSRADLLIRLGANREVLAITGRQGRLPFA
ncbi:kinase [Novosphingobium sp. FKTRR1]|uniref:kinase n=1 Tax=Novosphingobium sp. FKTRR1 TaxID=2879118 RepID=UPI00351D25D7